MFYVHINNLEAHLNPGNSNSKIREGEIYNGRIINRLPGREALLSIRGQEVRAVFTNDLPQGDRVTVKVEGKANEKFQVSTVEGESRRPSLNSVTNGSGGPYVSNGGGEQTPVSSGGMKISSHLQQTMKAFSDNGITLTKESVKVLNKFLQRGEGTLEERTTAAALLAKKSLEPTEAKLRAVQAALNDKTNVHNFPQQNKEAAAERLSWEQVRSLILMEASGEQNIRHTGGAEPEKTTAISSGSRDNIYFSLQKLVENEPDLQTAIQRIQQEFATTSAVSDAASIIDKAAAEAAVKLAEGRELKGRQIMIDALAEAEKVYPSASRQAMEPNIRNEIMQYLANEVLQSEKIPSKNILITEITERLARATDEFKAFQRDTAAQLFRTSILIQQSRPEAVNQSAPLLDNIIKQLDKAILKSDWMLYTDMKTEKKVMQASTMLAEAKKSLQAGNAQHASQLVKEVRQTLESLNFKPSNQKVQHSLMREAEWQQQKPPVQRLAGELQHSTRIFTENGGSPREILEGLRHTGLQREAELAQHLASGRQLPQESDRNLKAILHQLVRGEDEGGRQQAQQSLNSIAGQQLMSRADPQQNLQMLMFQLPLLLKGQSENIQVYVNSRNDGKNLDWENCNLYFLVGTERMGEVGISLQVAERALSIVLKNDQPDFENRIKPVAQKYTERLEDMGFYIKGVKFARMTETHKEEKKPASGPVFPVMTEKGFDFKI